MQGVSLALSLHAPDQELRKAIVPSARAYPLDKLMAAVGDYQAATGQRVFVEYVMLHGAPGVKGLNLGGGGFLVVELCPLRAARACSRCIVP